MTLSEISGDGAISGDAVAIHDFMTGHERMDVTCEDGNKFEDVVKLKNGEEMKTQNHLRGLLAHAWGGERTGIDDLIRAMKDGANSPNSFIASQSRESANAFGHYLSDENNMGEF
ncbi:hypothetical protein GOARA_040_00170, partial [Gordonia araii NBRC 100433]